MKTKEQAEKKAFELYPIDDFPFREDAEHQEELRKAFLKGYSQLAKDLVEWLGSEVYAPSYGEIYNKLKNLDK